VKDLTRDQVPELVSTALGGKPVRWAPRGASIGDYDGCDATLDIFDAPAGDQLMLLRRLRAIRDDIDAAAGSAVVFVFHTPFETGRLYPELSAGRAGPEATTGPDPRRPARSLDEVLPPATTVIAANDLAAGGITLSTFGPASTVGSNRWTVSRSGRTIAISRARV
jgi:hypothetical protein